METTSNQFLYWRRAVLSLILIGSSGIATFNIAWVIQNTLTFRQPHVTSTQTADDRGSGRVADQAEATSLPHHWIGLRGSGRLQTDTPNPQLQSLEIETIAYRGSGRIMQGTANLRVS